MSKFRLLGAGDLYAIDSSVVVPTPVKCGIVQDITLDISFSLKELFGTDQLADAVGRVEGKIAGKTKVGRIKSDLIGNIFLGNTPVTGSILPPRGEEMTIPDTPGPYTTTAANGANYRKDLGLWFKTTGVQLTRVADSPATGQYSLVDATGVYTYAAADKTLKVLADYLYNVAGAGKTITIINEPAQEAPYFMMFFAGTCKGQSMVMILNKCVSSKFSFPFKRADWTIQELDFSAHADDNGEVGLISLPE